MDLYRLDDSEQALDIGIEEILEEDAIKFIEWPEILDSLLPQNRIEIQFTVISDDKRDIEISVI